MAGVATFSRYPAHGHSLEPCNLIVFGPVIDLARLLSGFCADLINNSTFFDALLRAAELSIDNSSPSSSKAKETNVLLVLRTVANALQEGIKISGGGWIEKVRS